MWLVADSSVNPRALHVRLCLNTQPFFCARQGRFCACHHQRRGVRPWRGFRVAARELPRTREKPAVTATPSSHLVPGHRGRVATSGGIIASARAGIATGMRRSAQSCNLYPARACRHGRGSIRVRAGPRVQVITGRQDSVLLYSVASGDTNDEDRSQLVIIFVLYTP